MKYSQENLRGYLFCDFPTHRGVPTILVHICKVIPTKHASAACRPSVSDIHPYKRCKHNRSTTDKHHLTLRTQPRHLQRGHHRRRSHRLRSVLDRHLSRNPSNNNDEPNNNAKATHRRAPNLHRQKPGTLQIRSDRDETPCMGPVAGATVNYCPYVHNERCAALAATYGPRGGGSADKGGWVSREVLGCECGVATELARGANAGNLLFRDGGR